MRRFTGWRYNVLRGLSMNLYTQSIKSTIKAFPAVIPHLKGRARWIAYSTNQQPVYIDYGLHGSFYTGYKTIPFFEDTLTRLVVSVYNGHLRGEFIDIFANLISGQINQAYRQAWQDEGNETDPPAYLTDAAEELILNQYDYVDQYYRDIIDAALDNTPIDPLLARVALWAARWNEAYNSALLLIRAEEGGNLVWKLGATEEHCPECSALNGIVARASEWQELGVHPQGAPNDALTCGGWRCDCSLEPTDQRRSPNAYNRIAEITG